MAPLKDAQQAFGYPSGAAFEVVGADFLIDGSTFRPWLVEVNALPSMAAKASVPCTMNFRRTLACARLPNLMVPCLFLHAPLLMCLLLLLLLLVAAILS